MLEFDTAQGMFIDRQPYDIREFSPFTATTYNHVNTEITPLVPFGSSGPAFGIEPPVNYLEPPVNNPHLPGYNLNNEPYRIQETFAPIEDKSAYDYYPNLNAYHRAREDAELKSWNENVYLKDFDKTPEPIVIDPPLMLHLEQAPLRDFLPEPIKPLGPRFNYIPETPIEPLTDYFAPKPLCLPESSYGLGPEPIFVNPLIHRDEIGLATDSVRNPSFTYTPKPEPFIPLRTEPDLSFLPPRPEPLYDLTPRPAFDYFPKTEPVIPFRTEPDYSFLSPKPEPLLVFTPKPAFNYFPDPKPETDYLNIAGIVHRTANEAVFQGSGYGHFSHVRDEGFHATTNVPGFGKEEGLPYGLRIKDWP